MGVFDPDGNLIYCSAYRRNGNVINNYAHTIWLYNLTPGKYTIQCLQYGIGVCAGSSGNIMTFTIPDTYDRTQDPNNNYGYVQTPSVSFNYYFDISGLYFDIDPQIEEVGKYYIDTDLFECGSCTITAPSYSECKTAWNTKVIEEGQQEIVGLFDMDKYYDTIMYNYAGPPLNDTYYYCSDPIYYTWPIIKVSYFEGDNKQPVTDINLCGYMGDGSTYWNVCEKNGLEYKPDIQAKYAEITYIVPTLTQRGYTDSADGTYTLHYTTVSRGFINGQTNEYSPEGIDISSYLDPSGSVRASASAKRFKVGNLCSKAISIAVSGSQSMPIYNEDGSYGTYYSRSRLVFNMNWQYNCKMRSNGTNSKSYDVTYNRPCSPQTAIKKMLPYAARAKSDVMAKYNENPTYNEDYTRGGTIDGFPVEALFGRIPADKTFLKKTVMPSGTYHKCECVNDYGWWGIAWGITSAELYSHDNYTLIPALKDEYIADLSMYDPDNNCNNSSMWITIYDDNKHEYTMIFLRQNIIEVNTSVIPTR